MKKILIVIHLFLFWAAGGIAGDGAATFLSIPVGARIAAMGGAGVAIANDASAVYWNPALLGSLKGFAITSSALAIKIGDNGNFDDIESKHYFLAAALPLGNWGALGLAWQNFSTGEIEHRADDGSLSGYFDDSESALFFSYGIPIVADRMNLGLSFKLIQQKFTVIENASARGNGFSFGMSYQAASFLRFAIRADDNFSLKWDNGHRDQAPFRGLAGVAFSFFQDNLTFALDLEQVKNRPLKMSNGVEFNYSPQFLLINNKTGVGSLAARAGIDDYFLDNRNSNTGFQKQTNFTFGFGLSFFIQGAELAFDYSAGSYRIGNQTRFSLSMLF